MKFHKQTVFTKFAVPKHNPLKTWYGVVNFENGQPSRLVEYETKFRSEAVNIFRNKAKQLSGTLGTVGVY